MSAGPVRMQPNNRESQQTPKIFWNNPPFSIHSPHIEQVEIQIASWCNRSCSFCPSGTFEVDKTCISDETIENIIVQLEKIEFSGTIGLHLICEPLLNKRFDYIVSQFRSRLPHTYIRVESNGDTLDKNFSRLLSAFSAGLNEILINCYDSQEQRNERNRKIIDLVKQNAHIWYFNKYMRPPQGPQHTWHYIRLRDFYNDGFSLRNWAGHLERKEDETIDFPLKLSCDRPFRRLHINYLGEVILCNNDWKFEVVMGDINTESLDQVWNAPKFINEYRPALLQKNREMVLCAHCDAGTPFSNEPPLVSADSVAHLRGFLHTMVVFPRLAIRYLARRLGFTPCH